jgi:hypothetical protein
MTISCVTPARVHLVIELHHRWPGKVPSESGTGGAATYYLVGEERVKVVDRIDLGCGRVSPREPERSHTLLQFGEHEARFLAHTVGGRIATADDELAKVWWTVGHFPRARADKAPTRTWPSGNGVREREETRGRRQLSLRADVAPRYRIDAGAEQAGIRLRRDS